MTTTRKLIGFLDRTETRAILSRFATAYVHFAGFNHASVFFDEPSGCWVRKDDKHFIIDEPEFNYYAAHLKGWPRYFDRLFERAREFYYYGYTPKAGDIIFDVGAAIGTDTVVFSQDVGPTGRVYAFEAHPASAAKLRRMVELQKLQNVVVVDKAVSNASATFYISTEEDHESNTIATGQRNPNTQAVQGLRLDDYCAEHGVERIDFLKINIEGAETAALQGIAGCIDRVSCICVCCHDFLWQQTGQEHYKTLAQVRDVLESYGFEVTQRSDDSRPHVHDHLWAVPRQFSSFGGRMKG